MKKTLLALLGFAALAGCNTESTKTSSNTTIEEQGPALFELVPSSQSGINFVNVNEEDEVRNVYSYEYFYNGGGVAIGDVNNDELPDIYFTGNMAPNYLYISKGDFTFEEVGGPAGVWGIQEGWSTGCAMADVNGDGWMDIYECRSGNLDPQYRANALYINNGDGTFTDKAPEMGLADPGYSTQAAFFDMDLDGDLDMFLLNHSIESSTGFYVSQKKQEKDPFVGDKLYRNDNGVFTDVSDAAGIYGNPLGYGLGVAISDLNKDGYPDIFVTNDYFEQDYLYMNNGNGTFSENLNGHFGHTSHFSMGSDIADINNDGELDVLALDMLPEDNMRQKLLKGPAGWDKYQMQVQAGFYYQQMRNTLQLNNGNGSFSEIGQLAGISNTDWSWAALFADYDNDGYRDLYITNGYKRDYTNMDFLKYTLQEANEEAIANNTHVDMLALVEQIPASNLANYVFKNNGDLSFSKMTNPWGVSQVANSNGAAYADLDNDGDLDLVVNNINAEAFVYRNTAADNGANYLQVTLKGSGQNPNGLGAKVQIKVGDEIQYAEMMQTRGYQSSVEPRLHFGLGEATVADEVTVWWPGGKAQRLRNIDANQRLSLHQTDATESISFESANGQLFAVSNDSYGIDFVHQEDAYIDFKVQPLLPRMISQMGPKMASGDLDGNGYADIYICGAEGQGGALYMNDGSSFTKKQGPWADVGTYDQTDVDISDLDGDGNLDIILSLGGAKPQQAGMVLAYINKGGAVAFNALSFNTNNLACLSPADVDGDGNVEILAATRVMPGKYPLSDKHNVLEFNNGGVVNDGKLESGLADVGMLCGTYAADMNGDGTPEFLSAGEWEPIRIINADGSVIPIDNSSGWWNCVTTADIDGDGDQDIIAGNSGLNQQVKVSPTEPARLYASDFDKNGSIDPIMTYYIQGNSYPAHSLDELLDQLPILKKKYVYYEDYGSATINDLFDKEQLAEAMVLEAQLLESSVFINQGDNEYEQRALPKLAQVSPVQSILVEDFNKDGNADLLLVGNYFGERAEHGRSDASFGQLLLGNGQGDFTAMAPVKSGLIVPGDCRDVEMIEMANGKKIIVVSRNNNSVVVLEWKMAQV